MAEYYYINKERYSTESLSESFASTSILPHAVSCKSHPITTIRFNLKGTKSEKNVSETCLNPKFLAHILAHQECLKAINGNLKDDLKMTIKQIPGNFSALEISVEEGVMENMKLEEMYNVINKYCREQLKIIEHDIDEERFSFADLKLGKFLKGMTYPHCISIFFDGKLSLAGHGAEIIVFERDILSSILNDEVVRDSFSIEKEQLMYLKVIHYADEISKDFSVEVVFEDEAESGTVAFHGLREDVVNVQRNISHCLQNYHKRLWTRPLKRNEQCLLQEKEVIRHFKGVFKKYKCSYLITDDCLRVARKISDMDILKTELENALFVEMNHSLSKVEKIFFESEQWIEQYKILRNNTKKQVIITVEVNELSVTCLPHVQIQVKSCLESFLRERIKSELMEWGCSVDAKEFFKNVKAEEILQIRNSMEDSIMALSIEDDGILAKGTESGIKKCKQELKTIISSVKYKKGEFAASEEAVNHFLTSEGKRKLHEIEKKTRSVIYMKTFCKIKMELGNIEEDKGDVIVNSVSTVTSSTAAQSTVAKAIFEKGGGEFQNKLVQKTNGRMQYGEVVETEAGGNLQCKAVYHACLPNSSDQPEKDVRDIAMECLKKAGQDHHTSISLPALGTGTYNYPPDRAAKGLLDAIVEFTRNTPSLLEKVTIVLFAESKRNIKEAFQQEYQRRCQTVSGSSISILERGCITSGKFTIVSESQQMLTEAKRYIEEEIATLLRNLQA
ncbi:uncharacterized protein LOC133173516 [Saccostrea echinata]|uniref:uncharacterized protein LOC133173516 n=1 Tax=Saccostrea echinata TaxID=191078 RepID=UPI002A7FB842|nr:uncharacterized protein LOC133173516 [Saccostrea echinata]